MKLIMNGEPYIFHHNCNINEKGLQMNFEEKRELLINNLLDIYGKCGMDAQAYQNHNLSFWKKIFNNKIYPDIVINDFHSSKGCKAYYYVLPKGSTLDINRIPTEIQGSWVKIIYGSVFCLDKQQSDLYIKGCSYASQYFSEAVFPKQNNSLCTPKSSDKELAEIYTKAWVELDITNLYQILDKNFHYDNDSIFDDMASRDEYLDYLKGKFNTLRKTKSVIKVQLGKNGETGDWATIVKQIQNDGTPIVCGFFLKCSNGLINSISIREMDLPNF